MSDSNWVRRESEQLTAELEKKLPILEDRELAVYVRKVAVILAEQMSDFKDAPLGVFLIQDQKHSKWISYAVPGNRLFLSLAWIRQTEFENEMAAIIALELAHLHKKHVLNRIREFQSRKERLGEGAPITTVGPMSFFSFSQSEWISATEEAVKILYRAGYDPRGLVSFLQKLQNSLERSDLEEDTLVKMADASRKAVANLAPLLNPVIRTESYVKAKKRINRL